jgi:hypothetical protein
MHFRNREGLEDWNIPEEHVAGRKVGLSAMVRLKDEETWIAACLTSILPWFDEVVIQPCSDATEQVIRTFDDPKIVVASYPFDSYPLGPGHDACPADSVCSSAYYYNWALSRTTRTHVCKWDGDMVAMDWLGARVRGLIAAGVDRITFHGVNIVSADLRYVGRPKCPTDGVYRVSAETYYEQGPLTQQIRGIGTGHVITRSAFLHFKWARKPLSSATKQWPKGWEGMPYFKEILKQREPARFYCGEYPSAVKPLVTLAPV